MQKHCARQVGAGSPIVLPRLTGGTSRSTTYFYLFPDYLCFLFFFFGAFELARFEHSYLLLVPRPHSTGHLMCDEFVFGFVPSKGLRPCCTCWLAFRNGHTRDAKYCNLFLGHDLYIVCVVLFFFHLDDLNLF